MPRDLSASYSRCAARPSQNASHIIHTAATARRAEAAGGGGDQPAGIAFRWIGSKTKVSAQIQSSFFYPPKGEGPQSCSRAHAIKNTRPPGQSNVCLPRH